MSCFAKFGPVHEYFGLNARAVPSSCLEQVWGSLVKRSGAVRVG